MSIIQGNAHTSTGGYQIERSLRFNSADSAYLNRTPASASNRKTWTWSGWIKKCKNSENHNVFMGRSNGTNYDQIRWNSDDSLYFFGQNGGADSYRRNTTPLYRDNSSWYHLVGVFDSTNATAANRVKLYVNGVEVTAFASSSNPSLNYDSYVNATNVHFIGGNNIDGMYSNQYMTEINFIDGQALTPSDFGETDSNTGVWKPKAYTGTYGTNGFYLKFADNSGTTATTLGKDSSGNGNNWTPNNFSVGLNSSLTLAITQATYTGNVTLSATISGSGTVNLTGFGGAGNISGSAFTGASSVTGLISNWQTHTVYKNGVQLFTVIGGSVYNDGGSQTATQSRQAQTVTQNNIAVVNGDVISIAFGANTATPVTWGWSYPNSGPTLSITASGGATILNLSQTDSFVDSPTAYGTDTGAGGEVRGNYATWNPLDRTAATYTNGNLEVSSTSAAAPYNMTTTIQLPTSGKWYCEVTALKGASNPAIGIGNNRPSDQFAMYRTTGAYITANISGITSSGTPATWTTGDVIGIAYDADAGTLSFYKNGSAQSGGFTSVPATGYCVAVRADSASGDGGTLNAGQRPFAYTAPSGFKALCTQNLPTPTIGATSTTRANKYFDATTYTGNGTNNRVITTNLNEVGLAWVKIRSSADDHRLANIVTGGNKHLKSNNTDVESTATTVIQAFSGSTFTVGIDNSVNVNGSTYVAWTWAANGTGSTNTVGTITSTVSVNTTNGFSIVTYTGNGTNGASVGHGLGVKPAFIITKKRSSGTTDYGWSCWHKDLGGTNAGIWLHLTNGRNNSMWTDSHNSTTFRPADLLYNNENGQTYVNYLFAPVAGYSAFGSYTGNGSADGPFVYTGFRPRYVMWKRTDAVGNWVMQDTSRSSYNQSQANLYANLSNAEDTTTTYCDFLSNGFKMRQTENNTNNSGGTYIYAAFAENPFKYSLAR